VERPPYAVRRRRLPGGRQPILMWQTFDNLDTWLPVPNGLQYHLSIANRVAQPLQQADPHVDLSLKDVPGLGAPDVLVIRVAGPRYQYSSRTRVSTRVLFVFWSPC
jgi:hypothetical protein